MRHSQLEAALMELVSLLLTALLATTLFLFRNRILPPSSDEKKRLPPGPLGWPIFGNLLQISPLPHRDFASFCDKYGPLVHLRLGGVDAITTTDPDVIREILVRQDDVFASRPRTRAAVHLAYGCNDVALAPLGPSWKRMRRICMEHLLTTKRLDSFSHHRSEEAQHMIREVFTRSNTGRPINLRETLEAFSMNNVTRMLLGKRYFGARTSGPDEAQEFMRITHELFSVLGAIYPGDFIPIWRWIDPTRLEEKMKKIGKRVDDFHEMILTEHKTQSRDKHDLSTSLDFVDVLLSIPGEEGKPHMDDLEIKALIQFFFLKDMISAASDTSAVTNEWAMTEVIKHPHVMRKIQEELDFVVGIDRMVSESDLSRLNYLRCVVRETFRMHPAGPFLIPHESVRETMINGYYIPAKTRVFINTHGLGRNRHIWNDVDVFDPERHVLNGSGRVEINHGSDFIILPFSAGKRKCPGAPLGSTLVLLALARLFHCFDWSPPNGMKCDDMDTMEVYGLTMPKAQPLFAIARPRLSQHLYSI